MVTPPGWIDKIDAWRRVQADLPPRAEAIRRLVDKGLAADDAEFKKVMDDYRKTGSGVFDDSIRPASEEPWSDGDAPAKRPIGSADFE